MNIYNFVLYLDEQLGKNDKNVDISQKKGIEFYYLLILTIKE